MPKVELRVKKIQKGKTAGEDEFKEEMMKSGTSLAIALVWKLCNMAFESGVVSEDWKTSETIPVCISKVDRTEGKLYEVASLSVWNTPCKSTNG